MARSRCSPSANEDFLWGTVTVLWSSSWYYYNYAENVKHVVTEKENPGPNPKFEATRLTYAQNGRAVTCVLGETWDQGPANYDITYAREFRYDSARQRYMNRVLDPDALEGGSRVPLSTVWSDYDGDDIYGDFEIDGQTITELRSFELGLGKVDPWTTVGGADTSYYHTDMIGTTRFMTDSIGHDIDSAVHTAFGERISGTQHRYGYAGAWSYQTHDDLPFLHVGHRYYDPAAGRFLQRDPLGIEGAINVYVYAGDTPTDDVDPEGLQVSMSPPALAGAGFTAKEIAAILGCATAFAAAKSWDEWKRHTDAVERGKDLVRRLKELRKRLTRKKHKDAADKAIREETKKIKGHEKEIKQKWPKGEPPKPGG